MHWSDVMIKAEKARTIDLKSVIQAKLSQIYASHLAKSEEMRPQSSVNPIKALQGMDSIQKLSALSPSSAGININ